MINLKLTSSIKYFKNWKFEVHAMYMKEWVLKKRKGVIFHNQMIGIIFWKKWEFASVNDEPFIYGPFENEEFIK